MNLKKLASLGIAIVMVLAFSVPVFANNTPTYNENQSQSVTMQGGATVPKIQIVLPSGAALTNTFLLNPYKIAYTETIAGTQTTVSGDAAAAGPQVISPVQYITNGTNSRMKVDVAVTTTLAGNLKLLTAKYADDAARKADTKNNAFLYLNIKNSDAGSGVADFAQTIANYDASKSIVLKAGEVKKLGALNTPAALPGTPKYICLQFGGEMAEAPSTPWTTKDVAKVALAFTFTPDQNVTVTSG